MSRNLVPSSSYVILSLSGILVLFIILSLFYMDQENLDENFNSSQLLVKDSSSTQSKAKINILENQNDQSCLKCDATKKINEGASFGPSIKDKQNILSSRFTISQVEELVHFRWSHVEKKMLSGKICQILNKEDFFAEALRLRMLKAGLLDLLTCGRDE